ncbi:hypothetical protein FW784_04280 [Lysobacter lacus]|uniref:Uncharacterized protein n=1 Tax=Cognatilysobacter lacus TaxID=1643323 RepID=A0A5D8Z720_9GAMM|nr:hypothetical protein FW784_04280 [Lysobacter lacus]
MPKNRGAPLLRRKEVLALLGCNEHASRASWSHDLGPCIVFDAWEHQWLPMGEAALGRYPLRTTGAHYNLEESRTNPRRGHTRWQAHVDLVAAGRSAKAIVPVANDPRAKPNKGAKGWRPIVVEGHVEQTSDQQVWFCTDKVVEFPRSGT